MKLYRTVILATAFCSFATATSAYAASEFSNFYIFGDSLSDVGNGPGSPFTNPIDGKRPLWVNFLGDDFGISVTPSDQGGNDWAVADTTTAQMVTQTQEFLATDHHADSHALYSLWSGANDITQELTTLPPATIISNGVTNTVIAANGLHTAGARYIMIFNLPLLGNTAAVRTYEPGLVTIFNDIVSTWNAELNTAINHIGYYVIQMDDSDLLTYIQNNYRKFGFIGPYSSACNILNPTICDTKNPNQYIFFDGYHPSQESGRILAGYVFSVLQGPLLYGELAEIPFSSFNSQNASINNELLDIRTGTENVAPGTYKAFISGNYNPNSVDRNGTAQPGFNATDHVYTVGVDYRANANLVFGAAVGREIDNVDFPHGMGSVNLTENLATLFGGYQYGNAYATAAINYGIPHFGNFERNFQWGIASLGTVGSTQGNHYGAAGTIGYNIFDNSAFKTGPIAQLSYQHVHVNGFSESGIGNFADLSYASENSESLVSSIGWQAAYCAFINSYELLPFAELDFNHQAQNGNRTILANPVSANGGLGAFPFINPNGNYGTVEAGISGKFVYGVTATVSYDTTFAQNQASSYDVAVNLSVPFA